MHRRLRRDHRLGNDYFATRGCAPEATAGTVHYPGTYLAGVYNSLSDERGGMAIVNESMVNAPNWLTTTFRIEGGPRSGSARY
nr:hypothetical protein [Rhodococcus sp. 21391]